MERLVKREVKNSGNILLTKVRGKKSSFLIIQKIRKKLTC